MRFIAVVVIADVHPAGQGWLHIVVFIGPILVRAIVCVGSCSAANFQGQGLSHHFSGSFVPLPLGRARDSWGMSRATSYSRRSGVLRPAFLGSRGPGVWGLGFGAESSGALRAGWTRPWQRVPFGEGNGESVEKPKMSSICRETPFGDRFWEESKGG